jgi:hypothetical protein
MYTFVIHISRRQNTTQKTKESTIRAARKTGGNHRCSGMANRSCSIMVNNMGFTSGVSRVWQVGHVPCEPLVGGATERF